MDPIEKLRTLLDSESDKVQAGVLLRLLEYRYGKPVQPVEQTGPIGGPIEHTIRFGDGKEEY